MQHKYTTLSDGTASARSPRDLRDDEGDGVHDGVNNVNDKALEADQFGKRVQVRR